MSGRKQSGRRARAPRTKRAAARALLLYVTQEWRKAIRHRAGHRRERSSW